MPRSPDYCTFNLEPLTLLHAGLPIANPETICQPLFNSAVVAALYEGWTTDALEARQWISSGRIRLLAAQDRQVVVPLAAVVSPSMVLQKVGDRQLSHVAYSPLNGNSLRGSSQR